MIKGKKGDAFEIMMWIVRFIFIIIILFVVYFFINAFIITSIDTKEVDAAVFVHRTIYSRHVLAGVDRYTQRVYPGVSNGWVFYANDFDKAIDYYWNDQIAANITMNGFSKNYNKEWYENWLPLVEARYEEDNKEESLKGVGAVTEFTFNTTIVNYDGIHKSIVPLKYRIFVPNG